MATSLVSTGVQFPDSTIQTTAASASAVTLISTTNASAATTVDIPITGSYSTYKLVISNVRPSSQAFVRFKYTTNNFSTVNGFNVGSGFGFAFGYGTVNWNANNQLHNGVILPSNTSVGFELTLYGFNSSSLRKTIFNTTSGMTNVGGYSYPEVSYSTTVGYDDTVAFNGLRFYMYYSGTITTTGTFKLYGYS